MFRRMKSIITAAAVSPNMLKIMPTNLFATNGDSRTYEKDGYNVTYIRGDKEI